MRDVQVAERRPAGAAPVDALDRLTRAICVVSASADNAAHAATIDSFTVVSAEPALVTVSLRRESTMLGYIESAGSFAVSVLAYGQEPLARRFASRSRGVGAEQFTGVDVSPGHWTRAPLLHGSLAWFECELASRVETGDHTLVLGSLLEASVGGGANRPLLRQDRTYRTL